eukprot:NODE_4181_length_489_cov_116.277273_g3579_i0.p3 GENE.NODE_4181_length_489_cov_116.277273_g3579_i0~~NODE_4181_length_489_cov_116.277273_g3579_i0.p3  ORF type:complete len:57 (-),score=1.30 NODE_4181_length_489_cov_116.277273_g3579_i0:207-377(-)
MCLPTSLSTAIFTSGVQCINLPMLYYSIAPQMHNTVQTQPTHPERSPHSAVWYNIT